MQAGAKKITRRTVQVFKRFTTFAKRFTRKKELNFKTYR